MTTIYRNVKRGHDPLMSGVAGIDEVLVELDDPSRYVYGEQSWDGKEWYRFAARLDLLRINMAADVSAAAAKQLYSLSDYGLAMGYDWSAIRDSSSETIAQIEQVAKRYVSDADLFARLGI